MKPIPENKIEIQDPNQETQEREPCFVFTQYDRGAEKQGRDDEAPSEETAETESHRPH